MEKITNNEMIEEKVRRIRDAMAQEDMPLSEELVRKLYLCFIGDTSIAIERAKILEKYHQSKYNLSRRNTHAK